MADVRPLRGIRFDPDVVHLGGVLAPPYDVIGKAQREQLYGRDLRNIVRIDFGSELPDDRPGLSDRYTRAAEHLRAWLDLGVLVRDPGPAFYVTEHHFTAPDGTQRTRRGVIARVRATTWDRSDLRPHEHTLRGPKEDRLALMRATGTQTSPVFCVWQGAAGVDAILAEVTSQPAVAAGRTDGEVGLREAPAVGRRRRRAACAPSVRSSAVPASTSPTATTATRRRRRTRPSAPQPATAPTPTPSSRSCTSATPPTPGSACCRRIASCGPAPALPSASTTSGCASTTAGTSPPPTTSRPRLAAPPPCGGASRIRGARG